MNTPARPSARPGCTARRHDTYSAYVAHGCRCPEAREQTRIRRKRYRERRQPPALVAATGTRRRLQALMAIGWPTAEICARLGWTGRRSRDMITQIMHRDRVHRRTRDAVAALYEQLSMTPGPSQCARSRAAVLGYLPPLAWDDPDHDPAPPVADTARTGRDEVDHAAVARILSGDRPAEPRPVDLLAAVAVLVDKGYAAGQIATTTRIDYVRACRAVSQVRARRARASQGVMA